jgi:hypothetical protein
MEGFLAEQTSDEKNQETPAAISKCRNAGIQGKTVSHASAFLPVVIVSIWHRHSGLMVSPVPLSTG